MMTMTMIEDEKGTFYGHLSLSQSILSHSSGVEKQSAIHALNV
jgi:hypothetical protein